MVQLILDLPAGNAEALNFTRLPNRSKDNFPWLEAKQVLGAQAAYYGINSKTESWWIVVRKGSFGKTSVTIIGIAFTINLTINPTITLIQQIEAKQICPSANL